MKALLVLALVLAILLILLSAPMAIGGLGSCPACVHLASVCLAVLIAEIVVVAAGLISRPIPLARLFVQPLPGYALLRPPRLV